MNIVNIYLEQFVIAEELRKIKERSNHLSRSKRGVAAALVSEVFIGISTGDVPPNPTTGSVYIDGEDHMLIYDGYGWIDRGMIQRRDAVTMRMDSSMQGEAMRQRFYRDVMEGR
jgi:hypothetical protein